MWISQLLNGIVAPFELKTANIYAKICQHIADTSLSRIYKVQTESKFYHVFFSVWQVTSFRYLNNATSILSFISHPKICRCHVLFSQFLVKDFPENYSMTAILFFFVFPFPIRSLKIRFVKSKFFQLAKE